MVMDNTMDCKLPFHSISTHLLSSQFLSIIIHVFQIILVRIFRTRCGFRDRENYLKFSIPHNRSSKLGVQILLVSHTSTKSFLSEHLPQRSPVVISIVTDDIASFWIASFKLSIPIEL